MSSFLLLAFLPLISFALPSTHSFKLLHRDSPRPRFMTYYPDWAPSPSVDFSYFDAVLFAFALPDRNFQLAWDTDQAPARLSGVVAAGHATSTKVMLSIGGWSGSTYFSDAVSTEQNRITFANNIFDTYTRFNLDGIDIDWEYPGQLAQQGNRESTADTANMLQFFQVLRQKLPPSALISAAVQDSTFFGPNGSPMKDVSAFSQFVDWVTLMNYDNYGTRQPPGPNSALYDGCGNSSEPNQNAVGGYIAWTEAGFPPSKIVLGVPAYGYIIDSGAERLSRRSALRAYPEDDSGQILFRSLVDQGILKQDPNGTFVGSGDFFREWDDCSATPYLRSESAHQIIPYDDPESLGMKAAWAKKMGMGGINLFAIDGDTSQHHLTRALYANLFPSTIQAPASLIVAPTSSSAVVQSPLPSSANLTSSNLLSSASQPTPTSLVLALPSGLT